MKRNMDLVRAILLAAEKSEHGFIVGGNPSIEGYTEEEIGYHVFIMHEAGLVNAADRSAMASTSPESILIHLTWAGHDFLESAREPGRWEQAKQLLHKAGGGSFQIWATVLGELVKRNLGL